MSQCLFEVSKDNPCRQYCVGRSLISNWSILMPKVLQWFQPCLAACEDQTFKFLNTQASFPNEATFPESKTFCLLVKKLVRSCTGDRRQVLDLKYPEMCRIILDEEVIIQAMNCELFENQNENGEVGNFWSLTYSRWYGFDPLHQPATKTQDVWALLSLRVTRFGHFWKILVAYYHRKVAFALVQFYSVG